MTAIVITLGASTALNTGDMVTFALPAGADSATITSASVRTFGTSYPVMLSVSGTTGSFPWPAPHSDSGSSRTLELQVAAALGKVITQALSSGWAPWDGDTLDMRNFGAVEIQVLAVTGTITFTRSGNNVDYVALSAQDASFANVNPSAPGFYSLAGGGYLKWAGTGTVLVRGYN